MKLHGKLLYAWFPLMFCLYHTPGTDLPEDTIIDAKTIPACTDEQLSQFEYVKQRSEGLWVFNPNNDIISYAKATANDGFVPVNGRKMTLCGRLVRFSIYNGDGAEYDWNLNIVPNPDYEYLYDQVASRVKSRSEWTKCKINGRDQKCIQAEITPDQRLYENNWFPNRKIKPRSSGIVDIEQPPSLALNKIIGVYGPWVMDVEHDNKPEIHPCEIIWWREKPPNKEEYYIFGIQDDSNRFDKIGHFNFEDGVSINWLPWARPPITSIFRFPFEYTGQFKDHLLVDIEELRTQYIVTPRIEDGIDSDNGNNHKLRFKLPLEQASVPTGSNVLVEVNENFRRGSLLGVRFVELGKKANGNIIGYIQLTTAYGIDTDGQEGYHILKVSVKHPVNRLEGPGVKKF